MKSSAGLCAAVADAERVVRVDVVTPPAAPVPAAAAEKDEGGVRSPPINMCRSNVSSPFLCSPFTLSILQGSHTDLNADEEGRSVERLIRK